MNAKAGANEYRSRVYTDRPEYADYMSRAKNLTQFRALSLHD